MSVIAPSTEFLYRFPVHSGSAWSFTGDEWEVPSLSGLRGADVSAEDVEQYLVTSTVTQSITDFERFIQQVMREFWQVMMETRTVPGDLDIEQEVIAHLPPKRVFETTLRVRYGGRAKPNITLELMDDDL